MKSAIFGLLATAAQAQYLYPQARVVVPPVRAPVRLAAPVAAPVRVAAPPVRVAAPPAPVAAPVAAPEEVEEAPERRYWQFEFDQAQYNLDKIRPKVTDTQIDFLNQINPGSFPNSGQFSGILNNQAYQTAADQYDQVWRFERSKGANADRAVLRNADLGGEAAQLRADSYLLKTLNIGGNNQLGDILNIQRRGVDTERAEYNFYDARREFQRGEISRFELEEARREFEWKEDRERNSVISFSGNNDLQRIASFSNYNIDQDEKDYLWDAVDDAEYEFRTNPTRENDRAFRLAELAAEAADNKVQSTLADIVGNPLLSIFSALRENELEEEYYDLEDEFLHRDFRQERFGLRNNYYGRNYYGRNNLYGRGFPYFP